MAESANIHSLATHSITVLSDLGPQNDKKTEFQLIDFKYNNQYKTNASNAFLLCTNECVCMYESI